MDKFNTIKLGRSYIPTCLKQNITSALFILVLTLVLCLQYAKLVRFSLLASEQERVEGKNNQIKSNQIKSNII